MSNTKNILLSALFASVFVAPMSAMQHQQNDINQIEQSPNLGKYYDIQMKSCANKHTRTEF